MRVRALAAVAFLAVSAAGCGSKPDLARQPADSPSRAAAGKPGAPAAPPSGPPAEAEGLAPASTPADEAAGEAAVSRALEPWRGDLDGMVKRRYVRVLTTFSRTNYFLDAGVHRGLTYEAGKAFEDYLNRRLETGTIKVAVMFVPVRRDQLFRALDAGRGDIAAANLTVTPERRKLAEFASPFLSDVREVVVTGPGVPAPANAEALSGRKLYVRRSSSYFESLSRLNASLRQAGKRPVEIQEADEQLEDEDILEMVNAGLVPATVVDDHIARFWAQVLRGIRVHGSVAVREGGEIAWAIRRGAPKLKSMADAFARSQGKGTLTFNLLLRRYLQDASYVKNSASEAEQRKFRALAQLFRKYGGQYDLPWLLLAAQGYQESQLEQGRRSKAGAVGIMQIKPSTAAGSPVFIKGVDRSAERNIQAGAKYLRWIVDEYYKDEPMDRVDKGLFALASYNAGAGRIAGLRRKAERMGLDPNKWFQNVEVVAAREIGRETVQYVSNIYKYYVSYQLVMAQRQAREKARKARG